MQRGDETISMFEGNESIMTQYEEFLILGMGNLTEALHESSDS